VSNQTGLQAWFVDMTVAELKEKIGGDKVVSRS
jgi:hypothetical protein